jgi:hypothetical protein
VLPRAAVLFAAASAAATCVAVLVAAVVAAARRRSGSILGAALLAPAAWTAGALAAWLGLAELVARLGRAGDGPSGGRRGRW